LIEISSLEAIKQCTISGMGISDLPQLAVKTEVELGLLKELAWYEGDISVVIQLVSHKDKWISPALQAFLDITHDYHS
jgi:DNA-binding transcriptional LysR family regulator